MSKIGLKLWNINTDSYLPFAKDLFEKGIYDYIELYVVPGNIDKIPVWKKLNIPFDIHAPHSAHNMNLSEFSKRDFNLNLYKEVKIYADELNAQYIIFHGGTGGNYKEVANQLKIIDDNRALIENKPYKPLRFIDAKEYTGTKPSEIEYIMNNSNCNFCLDIGHAVCAANSYNIDIYKYIDDFVKLNPVKIHLSDIDATTELDNHLNFGKGSLDFDRILALLKNIDNITIETNKKSKENLDDFIEDVKFLKNILN